MHWAAPTSQYPAPQEAGHGIRGGGRDAAAVGDDNAERQPWRRLDLGCLRCVFISVLVHIFV